MLNGKLPTRNEVIFPAISYGTCVVGAFWLLNPSGQTVQVLAAWVLAQVVALYWASRKRTVQFKLTLNWQQLVPPICLLALFSPFYCFGLDMVPYHINCDECTIVNLERLLLNSTPLDIFGLSSWFGVPAMQYIILGWLGQCLGGITIYNERILNVIIGLITIAAGYLFFRIIEQRWFAMASAICLGSHYVFLGLSKMAVRDNIPVAFAFVMYSIQVLSLKHRCLFLAMLGGLVSGLSLYFYYPARIAVFVWFVFLGWLFLKKDSFLDRAFLVKHTLFLLFGMFLASWPLLVSMHRQADFEREAELYQKTHLLIFQEGRVHQAEWVNAKDISEGVLVNVTHGLTMFNNDVPDHSGLFYWEHHGFFDHLTGILIILGLIRQFRKKKTFLELFMLVGLVTEWFLFTFIVNKCPMYPRLLVMLPFSSYATVLGICSCSELVEQILKRFGRPNSTTLRISSIVTSIGLLSSIYVINIYLYLQYVIGEINNGQDSARNSSIGHYLEQKLSEDGNHKFYLCCDDQKFRYFNWGEPQSRWLMTFKAFLPDAAEVKYLPTEQLLVGTINPPFSIFLPSDLWIRDGERFLTKYKFVSVHAFVPQGNRLAVEVSNRSIQENTGATSAAFCKPSLASFLRYR